MAYLKQTRGLANRTDYLASAATWKYSDEWYTPAEFVSQFGRFDLDPCAGPISSHAWKNIRPPKDGLKVKWAGRVWLNPPFSNLEEWAARFIEHGNGLMLLNARPETKWFQAIMAECDAVMIPRGRIRFIRPDGSKPGVNVVGQAIFAIGKRNVNALRNANVPGLVLSSLLRASDAVRSRRWKEIETHGSVSV